MNEKIKPPLTPEQKDEICYIIGEWYIHWKGKIVESHVQHRLGMAKEELKIMICGEER